MNNSEYRIAIIGGGQACHEMLSTLHLRTEEPRLRVVGVADRNSDAVGVRLARELGVPLIVPDYRDFLRCDNIDIIVELTGDESVRCEVLENLPPNTHFLDHYASRFVWDIFSSAHERARQAAEQVKLERNRLEQVLDSLPYEILVINTDYQVDAANRTYLEASGLTETEVIGQYCYDLDHRTRPPCRISVDGCPHAETLLAGHSVATVVSYHDDIGREQFASIRAAPIREGDGTVVGVVEAVRDITPRVQTEEKLKRTRERLDQFIDRAPLFIYMKDQRLNFRVINRHALETLGLEEEDVIGKNSFALFPDEVARRFQESERDVVRTGQTVRFSGSLDIRDAPMHYSATLFPVKVDDEVIGLFGLIEDVTELRESERELHQKAELLSETQTLLKRVLENSRDLILLMDTWGMLLSVNKGAERSLGYPQEELVGTCLRNLVEDPEQFDELVAASIAEGHSDMFEVGLVCKSGERVMVNMSLTTIAGPNGEPVELVAICRDITRRLKLQNDLVRADRLAAIGKLAAGVAHEINNPLAVIDTIAGVIGETLEDEGARLSPSSRDIIAKGLGRMKHQVDRCTNITHSLLGFVRRANSGRRKVSVTDFLEESLTLMAPDLTQARIEIRRRYEPDLPETVTDPYLLQQVFVNLLKNAIDAIQEKDSEQGVIEMTAFQQNGHIGIGIEDNGVGISKEAQSKVFDLFHTSKAVGKGTGLGLSIVHDITKKLDARIQVASEVGKWTRFTLLLPLTS